MNKGLVKKLYFGLDKDEIVSIAVISPFLMQTIQYLLLALFGLFDKKGTLVASSAASMMSWLAKGATGLIFLWAIIPIWKRIRVRVLIGIFIVAALFFISYFLYPENRFALKDLVLPVFLVAIPLLAYSSFIEDFKVFNRVIRLPVYIIAMIGVAIFVMNTLGVISIGRYSMSLSYYLLLPILYSMINCVNKPAVIPAIIAIALTMIISLIGARGPLFPIVVMAGFLLSQKLMHMPSQRKRIWVIVILVFLTVLLLYVDDLLYMLNSYLKTIGISSRSLHLLASGGLYLSGREAIYNKAIEAIKASPILGHGLAGDYFVLNGAYTHNFFLEIFVHYGMILGGAMVLYLVFLTYKAFQNADSMESMILLMWMCLGWIPLLYSGTYITSIPFWVFVGFLFSCSGTLVKKPWKRKPQVN